jgi:hypothetical protein
MARQQLTIKTMTPDSCSAVGGPDYNAVYPSGWAQIGSDIDGEANDDDSGRVVSINDAGTIVAIGAHKNDGNASNAGHVRVYEWDDTADDWSQKGYDIDGDSANDRFGISVSINNDGTILAVGADADDDGGGASGRVKVFYWEETGESWELKGSPIDGEAISDFSGWDVSLDADGDVLAIGAYLNDGGGSDRGHVRVYAWNGSAWSQRGSDIDGAADGDNSGISVSLNSDGSVVAIGAWKNDDGPGSDAGHTRIFSWNGSAWSQKGSDIDGEASGDLSGYNVSINDQGTIVAIGAYANDGTGTDAGHTRVYYWDGSDWDQRGPDIDGEAIGDRNGWNVSLDQHGAVVAIGAYRNDGTASSAGHVRVHKWNGTTWAQLGADIDGEAGGDRSGVGVSLNRGGNIVAIGAEGNNGVGGDDVGHVRVYEYHSVDRVQVGDLVYIDHIEAGAGEGADVSSIYTYQVKTIVDSKTLTLTYISNTAGLSMVSPCDLCDGSGSSGACDDINPPHVFKRDLGAAFMTFME